jgi:hypothetical protein
MVEVRRIGGDVLAVGSSQKRKPKRSTIDRKARRDHAELADRLDKVIDVVDELIDFVNLNRNSLDSLWVEVECMQTRDKIKAEARKLEKELDIR